MPVNKSLLLALGLVSTAFAAAAFAQQSGTGLYLYGAAGVTNARFNKNQIDDSLKNAGAAGVASTIDAYHGAYKLQAGYMIERGYGIEGGLVDLGQFAYKASFTGGSVNSNIDYYGYNLAAVLAWPAAENVSFFGKVGALYATTRAQANSAVGPAAAAPNGTTHKTVPNLGLGFDIDIAPQIALRAGYERFFRVGDRATSARAELDFFSLGVKYSFR